MGFFGNKTEDRQPTEKGCICRSREGLFLDSRQLSYAIAALLLVGLFIFVGGYFWGQKMATDQVMNSLERDAFADQIYYSTCSLYEQKDDDTADPCALPEECSEHGQEQSQESMIEALADPAENVAASALPVSPQQTTRYYAQLAGFSSAKMADQLVNRLQAKGIPVVVHKRKSKTVHGKPTFWYQVITEKHKERSSLQDQIAAIKKHEKLRDIRIVETT